MDKPIIRPVEAFPMEQQDQTLICLRDPSGLAPEPIILGMGAYFLVTLFDGTNSTLDLQAAFSHRFGEGHPVRENPRAGRRTRQRLFSRFAGLRRARARRARGVPSKPIARGSAGGALL